jgi:uncharacterized cupin superfamily protein
MERKPAVIVRAAQIRERRKPYAQRLNPQSLFRGSGLASMGGLSRTGVSVAWLEPGKDSFAYHAHRYSEEWLYILAGEVICEVDGVEHTLGPGDFVAFPTPQVAHLLKNRSDADVMFLMGGERRTPDVIDYPHLGKSYLLAAGDDGVDFHELAPAIRPFGKAEE